MAVEADSLERNELLPNQQVNHPSPEPNEAMQRHAPLHAACTDGDVRKVEDLLSSGADPNVLDNRHRTPLHVAAAGGFADCLSVLLQNGARVDVRDLRGLTPLGVARDAICRSTLLEADAALSAADLRLLLRERPAAVQQLLDGGVQPGDGGVLLVSYKPLRDIGGPERPFEVGLVTELQRNGRWDMIGHPTVQLLLDLICRNRISVLFKLIWCVIFLTLLVRMAVQDWNLYRSDNATFNSNLTQPFNKHVYHVVISIMLTMNIIQLLFLMVMCAAIGSKYLSSFRQIILIAKTVLVFVAVSLPFGTEKSIVYAFSVLMAGFESILLMELLPMPKIAYPISSFFYNTSSIACYLSAFSPVLACFSVAIYVVLASIDCPLDGRHQFFHMAAMMLGEVDIMEAEKCKLDSHFITISIGIMFVMYVVFVPIVMVNMLLALTISDTTKLFSKCDIKYLQTIVNMIVWDYQAVFMVDIWVHKLKWLMPKSLFKLLAEKLGQLKSRSALPQLSIEDGTTLHFTVKPFTGGHMISKISVVSGPRITIIVRRKLFEKLNAIVQARTPAETVAPPPTGLGEELAGIREMLERQQAALERQQTGQDDMLERLRRMEDMLTRMAADQ